MSKQDKYTKSARGQQCQVRLPGKCNHNSKTVVLAHFRMSGTGMGKKPLNIHGAYCCSSCHDVLDKRDTSTVFGDWTLEIYHLEAVIRTQIIMVEEGILKL